MMPKTNFLISLVVSIAALFLSAPESGATTAYFNNFNSGSVGSEWTSSLGYIPTDVVPKPNSVYSGGFLGQFSGNNYATLSISGLNRGMVSLSFDTYFIRSWDGSADAAHFGPDYFKVSVIDQLVLMDETFSNGNPAGQSYIGNGIKSPEYQNTSNSSMTGSLQQYSLGYFFYDGTNGGKTQAMDSLYHFEFSFLNPLDTIQISFAGIGLQGNFVTGPDGESLGYLDESWGIDNVRVDITPVPEPSTLWLLSSGGLGLLLFRGKRYLKR